MDEPAFQMTRDSWPTGVPAGRDISQLPEQSGHRGKSDQIKTDQTNFSRRVLAFSRCPLPVPKVSIVYRLLCLTISDQDLPTRARRQFRVPILSSPIKVN
jgi:hypothetical protein